MKKFTRTAVVAFFLATILSCLFDSVRCQTILVPSQLHVGENNTLLLISESDSTAILALYEKGQSVSVLSQPVHFRKGQLVEWSLFLDSKIAYKDKVSIVITYDDGATSVEEFQVSPTNGFVFFQTDKPIYRVSQTVRFRVLRLSRTLAPINERVLLKIQNPQTIKVEEISLNTTPPYHIAEHSFKFPLIAKPGTWTAELLYGPNLKLRQNAAFEVTEYVLPLFKIEIFTPKFALDKNAAKVNITMKVSYTYGKPVRGTVHYQYHIEDDKGIKKQATSKTICFDGIHNHSLPASLFSDISQYSPAKFRVEAIVRECASGAIQSAQNSDMKIVSRPYSISLSKTIRRYKSNVNNYITFEVVDPHNSPVADVPLELNMTGTRKNGEVLELFPYVISVDSRNGVKTDKNGQVILLFNTKESNLEITVNGRTNDPKYQADQQTTFSFPINTFTAEEQEMVWIEGKKQLSYVVGQRFNCPIQTRGNLLSLYLIVISKGAVVYKEKLTSKSIDFVFTNRMVPSVRVLALAFTPDGAKYVADSIRLDVQPGNCGVNVNLPKERNRFEDSGMENSVFPGQPVTFTIKGQKGDVVGFHAVDEAVYVLHNERNSFSKYSDSLQLSDSGCGPGEAGTSPDVIRSAGFKVLSPNTDLTFNDNYCKTYARKRRSSSLVVRDESREKREKFLKNCCKLGQIKPKSIKGSCEARKKIVFKHTNDSECSQRFFDCCLTKVKQKIQFSASTNSTSPNGESTSKSEIKIKNEEVQIVDASLVRHDFRDTWLFDLVLLNDSREATFTRETPHSITSWFVSTFSLSESTGFCMNSPLKVVTFKPFFIKVAFPQTLVQHEQTEVSITVFNYNTDKRRQRVSISFTSVKDICTDEGSNKKPSIQLDVDEMSSARHSFPIVPLVPGIYQIRIQARSSQFTDTVIKNLTVVAPGIEKETQLTFDLDPLNRAKRSTRVERDTYIDETIESGPSGTKEQRTKVNLKVDRNKKLIASGLNIVPMTLHYIVTAVGERFSPQLNSIEELGKLIKKPKGCGEQNMYYMSFNLFTLMYLEKIGKLDSKLREKGVKYLKKALQQQLDFRKDDGSYSAFYKRNSSIWLTAFVAKVMCQSSHFLRPESLDAVIITSALKWLKTKQYEDGSWKEVEVILHAKALGGVQGVTALTAYLAITSHECRNYLDSNNYETKEVSEMITKANAYLAKDLSSKDKLEKMEPFSQALIAYSLSLNDDYGHASDTTLERVKTKLVSLLKNPNSAVLEVDQTRNLQHWKSEYPVETASYALMAIINSGADILDYISVVNWLSTQQKDGTFDNTQDTIVALEALAKYYAKYKNGEESQLFTNVTYNSRLKRSLFFNNTNADVLQTLEVDKDTKEIGFHTRGNGLGKVNVHIIYNEYSDEDICKFFVEVNVYAYKSVESDILVEKDAADEDFSEVFPLELQNDIGLTSEDMKSAQSKTISSTKPPSLPTHEEETLNCCSSRLSKRSLRFWNTISQALGTGRRNGANGNNGHSKRSEPKQPEQPKFEFSPLPKLNDENLNVQVLNICVRHLSNTNPNEMAILEVSILSGFKPVEEDLKSMLKRGDSYFAHYEISNSKVTIYLHMVPLGRNYCPYFRIYQEYRVDKIQSALVRIYNYYSADYACTRLYTDVGFSKNIPVKCNERDKTCKCVTDRKCPDSTSLKNILTSPTFEDRKKNFIALKCQYSNVLRGRVKNRTQITEHYQTPILHITVDKVLRAPKDVVISHLLIRANPQCTHHFETNSLQEVVILHNPQEDDHYDEKHKNGSWLLEGNSIFLPLDRESEQGLRSLEHFSFKSDCQDNLL